MYEQEKVNFNQDQERHLATYLDKNEPYRVWKRQSQLFLIEAVVS